MYVCILHEVFLEPRRSQGWSPLVGRAVARSGAGAQPAGARPGAGGTGGWGNLGLGFRVQGLGALGGLGGLGFRGLGGGGGGCRMLDMLFRRTLAGTPESLMDVFAGFHLAFVNWCCNAS